MGFSFIIPYFVPGEAIAQSISVISYDGNNVLLKYPDFFTASITSSKSVTFMISAESVNIGIAEFECALDGEAFVSCSGLGLGGASRNETGTVTYHASDSASYSNLNPGPHSFEARVILSDSRQIVAPYFVWEITDHPVDLTLNNVGAVQAYFDPSILIDGKKSVGKVESGSTLSFEEIIKLRITTGHPFISAAFFDTGDVPVRIAPGPGNVHYSPPFDAPMYGSHEFLFRIFGRIICVEAFIDSDNRIAETNEGNNRKQSCYPLKDTKPFSTIYIPVKLEGDVASRSLSQEELEMISMSTSHFIKGTYPIDEDEYFSSPIPMELSVRNPTQYGDWCFSINTQIESFRFLADLFDFPVVVDNVVGVVKRTVSGLPQTGGADGIGCSGIHGVTILLTRDLDDAAHEIAHTYGWVAPGFCTELGNCESRTHLISLPAPGYWVDERREMHSIDFMNPAGGGWISKYTFDYLLEELQTNPQGSQAIVIMGTIFNNGTADLDPWYR